MSDAVLNKIICISDARAQAPRSLKQPNSLAYINALKARKENLVLLSHIYLSVLQLSVKICIGTVGNAKSPAVM